MRVLTVLMVLSLAGCSAMMMGGGQPAGRPIGTDSRTTSQVAADQRITAIVRNRYAADAELSGQAISIDTVRGVVTLRGTVSDYGLRDRAQSLARDVPGVVRVVSQLGLSR